MPRLKNRGLKHLAPAFEKDRPSTAQQELGLARGLGLLPGEQMAQRLQGRPKAVPSSVKQQTFTKPVWAKPCASARKGQDKTELDPVLIEGLPQ